MQMFDLGLGNGFLSMIPKGQLAKEKNRLGFIKSKNFCVSKTLSGK